MIPKVGRTSAISARMPRRVVDITNKRATCLAERDQKLSLNVLVVPISQSIYTVNVTQQSSKVLRKMIPIISGLLYLGGGVLAIHSIRGLVHAVKTNEIDIGLLRLLDEANTRQYNITVGLLLLCFLLCYLLWKEYTRKTVIIIEDRRGEVRNMIEDIAEFRGQRLQISNGQHINHMIEEDHQNARRMLNSERIYKQQIQTAIRQSLKDQARKREEERQLTEFRRSIRNNFGEHRPRDFRPRKKPSKAFKNELEYETYIPTDNTDGDLRRRKRCDSRQRHNDLTIDRPNEFHVSQEKKLPFYNRSRGVEDIPCDNPREVESESSARTKMRTTMWDDEEILDLSELEELQIMTAMSRSIEEQ